MICKDIVSDIKEKLIWAYAQAKDHVDLIWKELHVIFLDVHCVHDISTLR